MKRFLVSALFLLLACGIVARAQHVPQSLLGVGQPSPSDGGTPADTDPLFNDKILHEIRLDINQKDWQTLKENYLTNEYYPADFRWNGQVVRNIGIRSRGNRSRLSAKPGLKLDFDHFTSNQTFLGLRSVVLRNNSTDKTAGMHEAVTMLLFKRLNEPAPRVAFARLYVNNAYSGIYSLVESLDRSFLKRYLNEDEGYLYKFQRNEGDAPYYFTYSGPNKDLYVPHPFAPETHENNPKPEPLVELIRIIAEASDANFRSAIAPFVDVPQFLRQVATTHFMDDLDGFLGDWGMNNFYLYQMQNKNLHVFLPWDKSESTLDGPNVSIFHNITDVPDAQQNRLMKRVMNIPDYRNYYLDTMQTLANSSGELITGDGRGWMEREIDREDVLIRDSVLNDSTKPYTNEQYQQAVEAMRLFARQRGPFVSEEVRQARQ